MSKKFGMAAALLAGALAAQDAVTIGTFVDPDGKPIAAATVTFATTPVLLAEPARAVTNPLRQRVTVAPVRHRRPKHADSGTQLVQAGS